MKSTYVEVTVGNPNFFTGKIVIVKMNRKYNFIDTYAKEAYKIACEKLGLDPNECSILGYTYLGPNVTFII